MTFDTILSRPGYQALYTPSVSWSYYMKTIDTFVSELLNSDGLDDSRDAEEESKLFSVHINSMDKPEVFQTEYVNQIGTLISFASGRPFLPLYL